MTGMYTRKFEHFEEELKKEKRVLVDETDEYCSYYIIMRDFTSFDIALTFSKNKTIEQHYNEEDSHEGN